MTGDAVTWTAPQRIPGSQERRIVHESGGSVIKTVKGRYVAFGPRAGFDVPVLGGFDSLAAAQAAVEAWGER